jgi:hypothetical protein
MRQRPADAAEIWNTDNVSGLERRLAAQRSPISVAASGW